MRTSKRGESLVEVLVAISIFMLVFSGVVSMISGAVTLNLSSRQRTVGVTGGQKYLNEYLADSTDVGACSPATRANGFIKIMSAQVTNDINEADCNLPNKLGDVTDSCYWISVESLTAAELSASGGLLDNTNFIKIVSHAKWYSRFSGEQDYQISKIVRNK